MSKLDSTLTQDYLREILRYDPATGEFAWAVKGSRNKVCGKRAGCISQNGYRMIRIDKKGYLAHRLAWFYTHGVWPKNQLDHIDRDKQNNRIANLREVDASMNAQNRKTPRSNKSTGLLGVRLCKKSGAYVAAITLHGKFFHIGSFKEAMDAHNAYVEVKRKMHPGCTI